MRKLIFTFLCLTTAEIVQAQNLVIGFHSPLPIRPAIIYKMLAQPDGKLLVTGDLNFLGTNRTRGIVRLNSDGSQDASFTLAASEDLYITNMELQSTGDIVFLSQKYVLDVDHYNIESTVYRISTTGQVKNKIDLVAANSITVQSDDKVLVTGKNYLHRYNSDLAVDAGFSAPSFDGTVSDVQQSGNSLIVTGYFSQVNGVTKNDLVKLNLDGSIDNTFDTGNGTDDYVGSITVQSDGKIYLGNTYINSFNGIQGHGTMRLNADGSVDTSFNPFSFNGAVSRVFLNGTDIYAAAFLNYNGGYGDYLFKLSSDGSMDTSFTPIELAPFGSFMISVVFNSNDFIINNSRKDLNVFGVSKFDYSANVINNYAPEVARFGTFTYGSYFNNKLLVAGDFVRVDGFETYSVVNLNGDGTVNQSFALKSNLGATVQVQVLSDESVLVSTGPSFVKLNSAGDIQPDFNWSQFGTLYNIEKFEVLSSGKIMASDGNNLYRLNADGSQDTDFDIGAGICCTISTAFDFDMQGSKVIFGSTFDHFNNIPVNRMVRLDETAQVDGTFDIGTGPDKIPPQEFVQPNITLIKVLESSDVLVGGYFTHFNGVEVPYGLVKLSSNGQMDLAFNDNQKLAPKPTIYFQDCIIKQIGEKVVIVQPNMKGIYVVNLDGTVDINFNIPLQVGFLNDLIPFTPSPTGGRQTSSASTKVEMFGIGSFTKDAQSDRSLLIKMSYDPDNLITAVEPTKQNDLVRAYPNPIERKLSLEFLRPSENYSLTFYDNLGRIVRNEQISPTAAMPLSEIDLSHETSGVYVMKVISESGKSQVVKLLKK
jgi:uncharacterized delta-60 repeat protein